MNALYVAIGGAAGSLARYYSGIWITNATGSRSFGTFCVNVVGSFIIGLFLWLSLERSWSGLLVSLVAVGFLGGFTTFSAFTWQTYQLLEAGQVARAGLNVAASVIVGLFAVWAGVAAARVL